MGIEGRHAYRFRYLKSEAWQNVRAAALARDDAVCRICGWRSVGNDAHHVFYPSSFYGTKPEDVVILCRPCHELAEKLIHKKKRRTMCFRDFKDFCDKLHAWIDAQEQRVLSGVQETPIINNKDNSPRHCLSCEKNVIIHGKFPDICLICKREDEKAQYHTLPMNCKVSHQWPFCTRCWDEFEATFRGREGLRFKDFRQYLDGQKRKFLTIKTLCETAPLIDGVGI